MGILGVLLWSSAGAALLLVSLGVDAVDGTIARKLDATSVWGANLDRRADEALAMIIAWAVIGSPVMAVGLVLLQVWSRTSAAGIRVSGRALVTLIAILWYA